MPVLRVDDEVWEELKKRAVQLGLVFDTPNTVLRKVLGLDEKSKGSRKRAPEGTTTPQDKFWKPILEALVEMGGQGSRQQVHKAVEERMKGELKSGDYERNQDGTTKWSKAVDYQRLAMVHEGLIAGNTPRGIWKITGQGRQWLSQH